MSKLSPSLKQLIARHAEPKPGPPLARLQDIFKNYDAQVSPETVSRSSWITLTSATLFTLNSPSSLTHLSSYLQAKDNDHLDQKVAHAKFLRELGLKCISFIGIAKIINQLGALHAALDQDVKSKLDNHPSRHMTAGSLQSIQAAGFNLWKDIYDPFDQKLLDKLATYHPDLPVHIIESHYGPSLSNPSTSHPVDRVQTSLVAIACLRAQEGVGPQVTSHVFGLRKAKSAGWLSSDQGCEWALRTVDEITEVVKAHGERDSHL